MDSLSFGGKSPESNNLQKSLHSPATSQTLVSHKNAMISPQSFSITSYMNSESLTQGQMTGPSKSTLYFCVDRKGQIQHHEMGRASDDISYLPSVRVGQQLQDIFPASIIHDVVQIHEDVHIHRQIISREYQLIEEKTSCWIEVSFIPMDEGKTGIFLSNIKSRKQIELIHEILLQDMSVVPRELFFPHLVTKVAIALNQSDVLLYHLNGDQLDTMAWSSKGMLQPNVSSALRATPSEVVLENGFYYCSDSVQFLFPEDASLASLNAESYVGIALKGSEGQNLGTLCCLSQEPLTDVDFAESILKIVAAKAAREIERLQVVEDLEKLNVELEHRVEERTQALKQSETDLRTIFNTAYDGIYIHEFDGTIIDVNDRALEMHGLSRNELMNLTIADFSAVSPEKAAEVQRLLGESARGETLRFEWKGRNFKDPNSPIDNEVALRKALISDHEVIIATLRDISERKQRERAMKTIIEGTASKSGLEFYETCVQSLSEIFHVQFSFLAKVESPAQVESEIVAVWSNDRLEQPYKVALSGTPYEVTLQQEWGIFPEKLQSLFPEASSSAMMNADSFLGVTIKDSQNNLLGILGIMDTQPLPEDTSSIEFIVQLFAKHIAGEMERQAAAEEIQKSQKLLRAFIDNSPSAIYMKDLEGRYFLFNQVLSDLLGQDADSFIGATDDHLFSPEIARQLKENDQKVLKGGVAQSMEEVVPFHEGDLHTYIATKFPLLDADGNPYALCGISTDISDRKRAEQELYESKELLQTVLDTIPNYVYWKDRQSVYLGCNQLFSEMAGFYNPADVIGKTDFDLPGNIEQGEFLQSADRQVMDTNQSELKVIEPQLQANGETIWFETNKVPLHNSDGEVMGVLGTFQDITLKKKAEITLKQLNEELETRVRERTLSLQDAMEKIKAANQAKSVFLANMSHELRTPLNGILGYAQILERSKHLADRDQQGISVIQQCGTHLLTLINDILDLSKIEAQKIDLNATPVHLSSLLDGIVEICRIRVDSKCVTFNLEAPKDLPEHVMVDEKRLRQILLNLIGNAIKFTDSGSVIFRVIQEENPSDADGSLESQSRLRFEVEDSGIGISKEHLNRLFNAFEQVGDPSRQAGGTGLGLAISQRIANMMGSVIQVRSELNRGSRFFFTLDLPIVQSQILAPVSEGPSILGYEGDRKKILVVDDRWENRTVFLSLLEPLGFEVEVAENGELGLFKLRENLPDLLILDLAMPVMDGFELLKIIRRNPKLADLKVIVSSASVSQEEIAKTLSEGGNDYLTKPISSEGLLHILEKHLHLTWCYGPPSSSTDLDVQDQEETVIMPPSPEILQQLLSLAQSGRLKKLIQATQSLAEEDVTDSRFIQRIITLAKQFKTEQIEEVLTSFLEASG